MKRFILSALFVCAFSLTARASDQFYEAACGSFTSVETSINAFKVSTNGYSLDGISVINPGTNSFIEVWDWRGTTTGVPGSNYIGKFDTTAKQNWTMGPFGLKLSTDVVIYNQGSTPAGVRIYYRNNGSSGGANPCKRVPGNEAR